MRSASVTRLVFFGGSNGAPKEGRRSGEGKTQVSDVDKSQLQRFPTRSGWRVSPTSMAESTSTTTTQHASEADRSEEVAVPICAASSAVVSVEATTEAQKDARIRAAWLVQALHRSSRVLAQHMYDSTPRCRNGGVAKQLRNRSAFISRHAARNYERLLADNVHRIEGERDKQAAEVRASSAYNARLRIALDALTASLAGFEALQAVALSTTPVPCDTRVKSPVPHCSLDTSNSPASVFQFPAPELNLNFEEFNTAFEDGLPDNVHDLFGDSMPMC